MIDKNNVSIALIVSTLKELADNGKYARGYISPLYNSLKKFYELTSDTNLESIYYSKEDFNKRIKEFKKKTEGKFARKDTATIYISRARRALNIFEGLEDRLYIDSDKLANIPYENVFEYYKAQLRDILNDSKKNNYIKAILCQTNGNGIAAIVVSHDSIIEDLYNIQDMIETLLPKEDRNNGKYV